VILKKRFHPLEAVGELKVPWVKAHQPKVAIPLNLLAHMLA